MSAFEVATEVVYLAILAAVLTEAARRPRREAIDAAIFTGALALLFTISSAIALSGAVPDAITRAGTALIAGSPYLLVRLTDDYRGVGRATQVAAAIGALAGVVAVLVAPLPYPALVGLGILGYVALVLAYCTVAFVREARGNTGLTRIRLTALAIGTGLLVVAVTLSVVRSVPSLTRTIDDLIELLDLASAIAYYVGLVAPVPVRRIAQAAGLRSFIGATASLTGTDDLNDLYRRIESAAARAIGAPTVAIALYNAETGLMRARLPSGEEVEGDPEQGISGRVIRTGRAAWTVDPARDFPNLADVYRRVGNPSVMSAPLVSDGTIFGTLSIQGRRRLSFARDDLEFLEALASHASTIIANARLLGQVRALSEHERQRGQEARSRLAAIVDSSPEAIIGLLPDGTITDWNAAAEELYGFSAAEALGRNIDIVVPADRVGEMLALRQRLADGGSVRGLETVRQRKDGRPVDISMSFGPIRDESGAIAGSALIAQDIGGRRAAEAQRHGLEARLRQSERLESIGRLVGGIAHDFNNMLAVILNYTEFIADRTAADDPIKADLDSIQEAAERAARFTRQLLTVARRGEIRPEDLDLSSLLEATHMLLQRALPESIDLKLELARDLSAVHADRGQLEQVFLNLVLNARDAMPDGGALLLGTRNVDIDEASAGQHGELRAGRYVEVTVTDTGHGMSPDVAARAFEPFFTTKSVGEGTGLGLATVYGIVQQAGGRITLYSEPERGTTVRILLPALGTHAPSAAAETAAPAASRGALILVIEDEPAVREAAARILRAAGYETVLAANGDEAVATAERTAKPIDLLLTDMVMPGRSGQQVARELRQRHPGLRVIYMSGYSEELMRERERIDAPLLQKPFTRASLLKLVAEVLSLPVS